MARILEVKERFHTVGFLLFDLNDEGRGLQGSVYKLSEVDYL
jgi:hypothetical protein